MTTAVLDRPIGMRDATRLRILVVAESFLPQVNGVTNSVRRVLEHLSAEGHDAELLAPSGPPTFAGFSVRIARGAGLPFYPDFRLGLETRRRIRAVMSEFRPDVVHLASPAALGHQAALAAQELGIPTVAVYQTDLVGFARRYGIPGGVRAMASLTRRVHQDVDRTLAPSSASLHQLRELGIERTHLWPRGVDLGAFHPVHRDAATRGNLLRGRQLLVGYVGRLAAEKELSLLRNLTGDARYSVVLVGSGPEERHLRRTLPDATFTGLLHGEELSRVYASLDVFVHTGRHETFCQSAQEALASGVPVVAPRSGGLLDLVTEAVTGRLYEPGKAGDLAAQVDALEADPLARYRMGRAGRLSVRHRSWAAINDLLVQHYREVVAARSLSPLG